MPRLTWEARFEKLRNHFGSHSAVARALSITVRHYLHLRGHPEQITGPTRNLMLVYCRCIDLSGSYRAFRQNIGTICKEW